MSTGPVSACSKVTTPMIWCLRRLRERSGTQRPNCRRLPMGIEHRLRSFVRCVRVYVGLFVGMSENAIAEIQYFPDCWRIRLELRTSLLRMECYAAFRIR